MIENKPKEVNIITCDYCGVRIPFEVFSLRDKTAKSFLCLSCKKKERKISFSLGKTIVDKKWMALEKKLEEKKKEKRNQLEKNYQEKLANYKKRPSWNKKKRLEISKREVEHDLLFWNNWAEKKKQRVKEGRV